MSPARRFLLLATVLVATLLSSRIAVAEPTEAPSEERAEPPSEPPTETRWYGWQTLLVDASTVAVAFAAEHPAPPALVFVSGAPIIHLLHGRPEAAGMSVALRTLVPAVAALPGLVWMAGCEGWGCVPGVLTAVAGAGAGGLAALIVDAAVLAKERVPVLPASRDAVGKVHIAPSAGLTRGGAMMSVGGTF
ncbi:MAG: hypothetical protein JST00_13680 [Deltaproteobacteria bacterium]|nr:hypothetical protein [Deltaproteobacteria bacterium]